MRKALLITTLLAGCTASSVSVPQQLIADGTLAVTALETLQTDAQTLKAPAADIALIGSVITAIQTADNDLSAGTETAQGFVKLATDEINGLAPTILADLHANPTIATGITLLTGLLPILAADVTPVSATPVAAAVGPDVRQQLRNWIGQVK